MDAVRSARSRQTTGDAYMYNQKQALILPLQIFRVFFVSLLTLSLVFFLFTAKAFSAQVTLAWDPNTEPNLAGYKLHYGFETGKYVYTIDVGDSTSFQVTNLEENQAVYFAATAYDVNGIESDYSREVVFMPENQPPVADAGPDQTTDEGTVVNMSGINSSDPEGGGLSYFWEQTNGSLVVLSNPESAQPGFTTPDVGQNGESLIFRLTVTDGSGLQAQDSCTINVSWVNIPPTANAGPDVTVDEGREVTLNGLGSSDPDDGIVAYLWEQTGGPEVNILDPTDAQTSFIAPYLTSEGVSLSFRLTVQDSGGLIANDTCMVNVTWLNTPPTADAGRDQTVLTGDTVTLDGSASLDPDDGIASVRWTQTDGMPVTLSDPGALRPKFTAPAVGRQGQTLVFQITVTDKRGLVSQDACVVTVSTQTQVIPPRPDIKVNGQDGAITIGKNSHVSVSISIDPGDLKGKTVDLWLLVEGPQGCSFYVYKKGWQRKATPFTQYPIDVLVSYNAFTTRLTKGNYLFHFAIDGDADGLLDGTWVDTVSVKVN